MVLVKGLQKAAELNLHGASLRREPQLQLEQTATSTLRALGESASQRRRKSDVQHKAGFPLALGDRHDRAKPNLSEIC